jgi:hypothetical protein
MGCSSGTAAIFTNRSPSICHAPSLSNKGFVNCRTTVAALNVKIVKCDEAINDGRKDILRQKPARRRSPLGLVTLRR